MDFLPRRGEERPAAPRSSLIRLKGGDALPVLHRISTQALADLAPGQARVTLFCDLRGRLLHRAVVAVTGDSAVWLLRDDAPAEGLCAYVERHVFREDVRIADRSYGRRVRAVSTGFAHAPGTLIERDGTPIELQTGRDFGLAVEVGMDSSGDEGADPGAEVERILAGRPRHGHEVDPGFNPYEVGLAHEVHLDKGCFTGQEALMRLVTYRGVRRRLALVSGSGRAPDTPRDVRERGASVGRLTSAAPRDRGWVGLAVLRREALEPGTRLEVEGMGVIETPQPFPETQPLGLPGTEA